MLNIFKDVDLTLDEQGRIQAEGLKSLPNDQAVEIRQLIKNNRDSIVEYLKGRSEQTTCPVCGGTAWWRENSPGSSWFCYWCDRPFDLSAVTVVNRGAKPKGENALPEWWSETN